MDEPQIFEGRLHAPFFIYFRRQPGLSDQELLTQFGLTTHRYTAKLPPFSTYVVLADVGEWTMLADDWLYQLWHLRTTRTAIESLAKSREVFAWSVGDCDQSFEYCHYQDGRLVRQYTVDSPHFDDQIVRTNFGQCSRQESKVLASGLAIEEKMHRLCCDLGINPAVSRDGLRLYSKPYKSNLSTKFGIRNF